MNPTVRARSAASLSLLIGILMLVSASISSAQLMVQMKMNKDSYMAYEPVKATITVSNRSGHDVILDGPAGRSWLTFDVYDKGQILSPSVRGGAPVSGFLLGSGKSISKTVNIRELYPLGRYGNYVVNASVYFPPLKRYFTSKKTRVSVMDSRAFWKQSVGVRTDPSKLASFREFSLHQFRDKSHNSLYVRLRDADGGRVYSTYSIGRYIDVRKPQATVDAQNNLHVLHMVAPRIYSYGRVSPHGEWLGNKFFRESPQNRPSMMIDGGGVVQIVGGTPYNPDQPVAAPETIARPRMASERPAGLPASARPSSASASR